MKTLVDRSVVVTGAAQGIGLGITRVLLKQGANVVMLDRNQDALVDAKQSLDEILEGQTLMAMAVDVTDESAVADAFSSAHQALGGLTGLVNNAGVIRLGAAADSTKDDWELQLSINVTGTFVCCNAFRRIATQGGAIVNIASNAGKVGYPNMAGYNASKAAVISMTRTFSAEWAPLNINVNAVCPGGVLTPMLENVAESISNRIGEPAAELLATMVPAQLNRHIHPEEVGAVVSFLLSDDAVIIRGQSINVDGGDTPY